MLQSPHQRCYIAVKEPRRILGVWAWSVLHHVWCCFDVGTAILNRSVIRFIPWHILSASFQLKIVFLLSWVSLSCYEARPREPWWLNSFTTPPWELWPASWVTYPVVDRLTSNVKSYQPQDSNSVHHRWVFTFCPLEAYVFQANR